MPKTGRLTDAGAGRPVRPAGAGARPAGGGGRAESVRLLADHGALVDATGHRGTSALQHAALYGRLAVLRLLLARGADPDAPDHCPASVGMGGTALMACLLYSRRGHSREAHEAIQLLLEHGADPGGAGASGRTPLMLASAAGEAEITGLLLRHGPDPDVLSDAAASAAEGCSRTNALQLAVGSASRGCSRPAIAGPAALLKRMSGLYSSYE